MADDGLQFLYEGVLTGTYHFESADFGGSRILYCGWEQCAAGHFCGPHIRPHYLMVYAVSGGGIFRARSRTYRLGAGSTFVIFPGENTYYCADGEDPWFYYWIAFEGEIFDRLLLRASVTPEQPVHCADEDAAAALQNCYGRLLGCCEVRLPYIDLKAASALFDILHALSAAANLADRLEVRQSPLSPHVQRAVEFVKNHYGEPLSVSGMADALGLSREHLSALFREEYGIPPVRFIREYRLYTAATLLLTTRYPVAEIAAMTGFSDYNYFSNQFSRRYGMSPSRYRQSGRERIL